MAFKRISAVDITPTTTSSYIDTDVSSYVSEKTTGVMLLIAPTSSTTYNWDVRKNGSTDSYLRYIKYSGKVTNMYIGVDDNKILELYVSNTSLKIYLIGYIEDEAVFLTNAVQKTPAKYGVYCDIDITSEVGTDTPIGAILSLYNNSTSDLSSIAVRKNGSTDSFYGTMSENGRSGIIMGVDDNNLLEMKTVNSNLRLYVHGYIKSGVVFNINATNISLSTTGEWTDLSSISGCGAIIQVYGDMSNNIGLRKNGDSDNYYGYLQNKNTTICVEADSSGIVEGYVGNTAIKFYLTGYFEAEALSEQIIFPAKYPRLYP